MRNRNVYFVLTIIALVWIGLWQVSNVYSHSLPYDRRAIRQEAPPVTPQPPQPDGSIIHEVRPGDTLWAIAIAYGVNVDEIRRLNNIPPEVGNIYYGQKLIIKLAPAPTLPPNATIIVVTVGSPSTTETPGDVEGEATEAATEPALATESATDVATVATDIATDSVETPTEATEVATSTPTEAPSPTPTVEEVTATLVPLNSKAEVCITAFNDANQNHWHDADESLLADVELTFAQGLSTSQQVKTTADDAACVTDLQTGILSVNAVPPTNYGLTTSGQLEVEVKSGEKVALAIGAAEGYLAPTEDASEIVAEVTATPVGSERNVVNTLLNNSGLLVMGLAGFILIGAFGVVLIARRG